MSGAPPGRPDTAAIAVVLTDLEGTTTSLRFVRDVLFPLAAQALDPFLERHGAQSGVAQLLAEVERLRPGASPRDTLLGWMAEDAKVAPLKTLQGLIWRDAYAAGQVRGHLYPDVPGALRAWHAAGLGLAVFSSGSVEAQRLLMRHAEAGDLEGLFRGWFDTGTGAKREAGSYGRIAAELGVRPEAVLFLSDVEAELDAAAEAGMATCQLVRPEDGTVAGRRHLLAGDFPAVASAFGLPSM